jgi:hypothetical protein
LIFNKQDGWIGYRLNILGIRVWADKCQLIAKSADQWVVLGPQRPLPVDVPLTVEELARVAPDSLLITAFQYMAEHPHSDLAELLAQRKDIEAALHG